MSARRKKPLARVNPNSPPAGEVGYGKPPRQHQFAPGRSGNPKGRPKGSKNESTIFRAILGRKIAARSGSRARKIMVLEGIILRLVDDSLKGNIKSAAFLLNRYSALVSREIQHAELSEDDREILEAALARRTNSGEQGGN
jgi:hypothetical protein